MLAGIGGKHARGNPAMSRRPPYKLTMKNNENAQRLKTGLWRASRAPRNETLRRDRS
jgi:hypothetical protein